MPAVSRVNLSGNPYIDGLLSDSKWAVDSLTFSFPATAAFYGVDYGQGEPLNNFEAMNATQMTAVRSALGQIASVANMSFAEVAESSLQQGDLRFAMSDEPSTAWAYFPTPAEEGGDAWFRNSGGLYDFPQTGNYANASIVHEIGHAMGLHHTHELYPMPAERDSLEYTVMSYRSYVGAPLTGYTNETWGYPQSLMMYDIAALQYLYGANYSTNNGNTVYKWSPTTGEMSINGVGQGAPGANRIFQTVWDGGGVDTYDFSNYATALEVDLRPGEWTTTSSTQLAKLHYDGSQVAKGNIANALLHDGDPRSLIENARGGAGNDTALGNAAANYLWGNEGDDKLYGLAGHDMLFGGFGTDHHDGGDGFDYARYDDASYGSLRVSLAAPVLNTGAAAGDTFASIEGLILGGGNDWVYGDSGANYLYGQGGNDCLFGSLGADYLHGGAGFDYARFDDASYGSLRVSLAAPVLNTGAAAGDTFASIEGLILGGGNDWVYGDSGANYLYGQGGNDCLFGSLGADYLHGGAGFDYARFDDASYDGVTADLANIVAGAGAAAGDVYVEIDGLILTGKNDTGYGDSGANYLYGLGGSDTLYGREGNDHLFGGSDKGVRDTFVFDTVPDPANSDVIADFEHGVDKIALSNSIYSSNPSVYFDAGSCNLFWPGPAGSSAADDVLIATLLGVTQFDSTDYYFY